MSAAAVNRRAVVDAGWWLALALLWVAVIWRWWPAWGASAEHSFGFLVPLLAAGLAWERRRDRPATSAPSPTARRVGTVVLAAALLALPGALIVLTANPMWPAIQWVTVGAAIVSTMTILWRWQGGAVARHFAFPVLFLATALTWPAIVTVRLVGALVAMNASLAATAVSLLGHPAVVHGAVIELANGTVGVDEACSGLRSLQTVWMAGWFFGELFRLGPWRRVGLVAASMLVALVTNWLRTAALTWLAAARGIVESERWHDRAGEIELAVTLGLVALLAWRASRRVTAPAAVPRSKAEPRGAAWPAWVVSGAGCIALVSPEIWYRFHEYKRPGTRLQWELRSDVADWRELPVPERTRELLNASVVRGLSRGAGAGEMAFVARWEDDVARTAAAELHDPTICVPAAGQEFTALPGRLALQLDGAAVEFFVGRFGEGSEVHHVFYAHWDAWLGRSRELAANDLRDVAVWRIQRVREGRRRGDASYIVFVTRAGAREEAEQWMRGWAPLLITAK